MSGFSWQARVYWEDTDAGGIVYYANYLRFLERARSEWLRSRGISQSALARDPGVVFSVVELQARYHRPARLEDMLRVDCEPSREGGASLRFNQRIWRESGERGEGAAGAAGSEGGEGTLVLSATVRVACVDARTMKPRRLPAVIAQELP
ncbi:MAG TPA: tol-pal system-associated acyl-CoA thioesterase [Steroidobacteraceae bacterium]|nr:tol-pal system-associated acyl-CoA thioesterase [Steroidobacteraceae bacterium]